MVVDFEKFDELIGEYSYELDIIKNNYNMMGKLLDKSHVKEKLFDSNIESVFIYGGDYLGIMAYQVCSEFVDVKAVIDKTGSIKVNIPGIPVIDIQEFKRIYNDEYVIISLPKYYYSIVSELADFVPESKIIFIGKIL